MLIKRVFAAFAALMITLASCSASALSAPARDDIATEKIVFNNPDFIRGMDVSSVLSLESSGVSFKNAEGKTEDIFKLLSDSGVNYIRVRVWNDPYDSEKNGYGGGNSDVAKAARIGRRAAENGMKLLVDFHYSDFWADPSKQKAPKAWEGLSLSEKAVKLSEFTKSSLTEIKNAGADIGMVQIGNETNNGIAGESGFDSMAVLFGAGARAVREFDGSALVALHFTDPENADAMKWIADTLAEKKVDYDVFASSYYPYWHGSLDNLTDVFSYISEKYGKYTMVAETSYAYSLDDFDGHGNTVSRWNNSSGENLLWSFTPQGQANEVESVMKAVNSVGEKGLGVFYWEGAWITVGDVSGLSGDEYNKKLAENKSLWESFGSGWASSFSVEYDPDDAGVYCGGSAVDNQAFFDKNGQALPSLNVFKNVLTGSLCEDVLSGDADGSNEVNINDATLIQLALINRAELGADALLRADVDRDLDVDINDATLIQRYLARYNDGFGINTKR